MNFYEFLPHEYSYALYLAYIYDLHPFDSMIINMVSERYPRDEDDDASAHDSETDEAEESGSAILKLSDSHYEFVFGSFNNPIKPVSNISIKLEFDGFSIKVGEISCPLMDSCCNIIDDDESAFTASEGDKTELLETMFVSSATIQKIKNRFVVLEAFARSEDFAINTLPVRVCGSVYGVSAARSFASWLFVGKQTEPLVSSDNNQLPFFKIHDESIVAFDPGERASLVSPLAKFVVTLNCE